MSQIPGLFQQWVTNHRFLKSIKCAPLLYTKPPHIAHFCLPRFDCSKNMSLINPDRRKKRPPCRSVLRPAHRDALASSSILLDFARIYVKTSLTLLTLISFLNLFAPKFANAQAAEAIALALSGLVALVTFFGVSYGKCYFWCDNVLTHTWNSVLFSCQRVVFHALATL
jgi:hypothetical protein